MFVIANLLATIAQLCEILIQAYSFIVIAAALVSWLNPSPYNPLASMLNTLTEPVFYRLRKRFPVLYRNGMDFSPLVVLLALQLFNGVVIKSILQLAVRL